MNTPPLLRGAVLIFNGWFSGPLVPAAVVGLVLEAPRFVRWRLEIDRRRFTVIWNISVVLFVATAVYFIVKDPSRAVASIVQWAPAAMLPMMLAIRYSVAGKVDLDVLSLLARNRVRREGETGRRTVTLAYPYLLLCIFSASTAGVRTPWFYAGVVVFATWALWGVRSRTASPILWLALLAIAGALGYAGHVNLHRLQGVVEQTVVNLYTRSRSDEGEADPKHAAIGRIGPRKLSDRIVLRVELPERAKSPLLLREAVYHTYRSQIWTAADSPFEPVQRDKNGTWRLGTGTAAEEKMIIHGFFGQGEKVLPLPLNAAGIEGLPALRISQNQLGTVTMGDGPDMADYRVLSGTVSAGADKPSDKDVAVPEKEAPMLKKMARDLGLSSADPDRSMEALGGFFRNRFQYSLVQSGDKGDMQLSEFLLTRRAGHCEYFATATVLLLRAAGIPARYAVGYSVQEYSDLEKMYVARARHAHAWCLVNVDGAWRDFDTTPPSWSELENTRSPVIGHIYDRWQRLAFLFSRWRNGIDADRVRTALARGLVVIVIFLAWKFIRKQRVRGGGQRDDQKAAPWPGRDSEFYAVEKHLREQGFLRQPWEPTTAWLKNIRDRRMLTPEREELLRDLLLLHDRYRFDPNGISAAEREALRVSAKRWLETDNPALAMYQRTVPK